VSEKIVFNGREYDGIEAMPPEVRQQFEAALNALGEEDRARLESAEGQGAGLKIDLTVHRKYKVNGVEYDSVDAMPAHVRAAFEKALEANPSLRDTATSIPTLKRSPGGAPVLPPAIDAADARRASLVRVAVWAVIGLVVLIWLLTRR
jgi:hypothetical protein